MRKKRILAVLLSSAIVFSGMPGNVFAAEEIVQEDGFSDGETADVTENPTEDVTEEPVKDVGESVPESNQDAEYFAGFSDGESEDFVAEEELEDETDPETQVFADDEGVAESGKCGKDLTYTIIGDEIIGYTLVISGIGDMYNYSDSMRPWYGIRTNITNVIVENGVTSIANYAFYGCYKLKTIEIKAEIEKIGEGAFNDCKKLESIIIPESVTDIRNYTFYGCISLKKVVLPKTLGSIGISAFDGCSNLIDITMPETLGRIEIFAFHNCSSLEQISLPEEVTNIGYDAFSDCTKLQNVKLPSKINKIESSTFYNCSSLTKVVIPDGVTKIGISAFYGCNSLCEVIIPDSVVTIERKAFSYCRRLTEVTIPKNVLEIGDNVFDGCESLIRVTLHEDIITFGESVFLYDSKLNYVRFTGSKEQWNELNISAEDINNATVYYNYDPNHTHSYEESIIKAATCVEVGEKILVCKFCGESYTEEIPATGHTIVISPAVEATCTEPGKTEGSYCSVCGEVIVPQSIIPPTGKHSWDGGKVTKTATCVENGIITYTCAKCGATRTEEIKALGHTIVMDQAVLATCIQTGKTEGSHCSVCGEVIKAQEEIPVTGHRWGEWEVIKESTAIEEGWQQRTCKICGMHDDEMIPKLSPAPTPTVDPINPSTVIITKGKTTILKPDSSWKNVKYSSSNKKVATVDKKGKVKAVAAGTVKITVKSGSQKAVYTIVVPGTTAIKGVKSSVSVKKGKSYTLKPKLSYTESPDKVTYKSSNKKIATVSKKGVIKGKKKGTATITIKSGKITKKCKVKVK